MVKPKKREGSFDRAVGLTRWNMKMLGLWPQDGRWVFLRYLVFFLFSCVIFVHPYLHVMKDQNASMDSVFLIFGSIPIFSKFIFAKLTSKRYDVIVKRMANDWTNFDNLSENGKRILVRYANKARWMNVVCLACATLSYFAFVLAPLKGGTSKLRLNPTSRRLPAEGWFPFDEKLSPFFELTYVTQLIQTFFLCVVTLATDSFLCIVVLHACGQLALLSETINDYSGTIKHKEVGNNKDNDNDECACLSCIVKKHVSLIEYVNTIEDSFSGLILFQLLGNSFLLSVEGYLFVVHAAKNDISGIVTYTIYAIAATYSLFIYCFLGEYVIEQAEDIRNSAYNLKWYDLSSRSATPLILLIRSGVSCKITAGRFSVMRLSYYKKIITTSISYISVLRAIK